MKMTIHELRAAIRETALADMQKEDVYGLGYKTRETPQGYWEVVGRSSGHVWKTGFESQEAAFEYKQNMERARLYANPKKKRLR